MKALKIIILTLFISLMFSNCVSKEEKLKKEHQKIINEYNIVKAKFSNLFKKIDQFDYLRPKTIIPDHILTPKEATLLKDSTKVWINLTKNINDSLDILSPILDSLYILIEDFPNFKHFWEDKPYKDVYDAINKVYRIHTNNPERLYSRDLKPIEIQWNMQDVNQLKNIITSVLKFEPEEGRNGSLVWTTRLYDIEITKMWGNNLEIRINDK